MAQAVPIDEVSAGSVGSLMPEAGGPVPALGYGTYGMSSSLVEGLVPAALTAGFRHIDTAQVYGNEAGVGEGWVTSGLPRSKVFLTTKVWVTNFSRGLFRASVNESLRQLKTDHVDLLLLHWPHGSVPLVEQINNLNETVDAGTARFIGVSNYSSSMLEKAARLSKYPLVTNQFEYHPYLNQRQLVEATRHLGMTITAYCAMAVGRVFNEPALRDIAATHQRSVTQVVLRWLLQQPQVVALSRTTNPKRLAENVSVFDFELTSEDMARIFALVRPGSRIVDPPGLAPKWDSTD